MSKPEADAIVDDLVSSDSLEGEETLIEMASKIVASYVQGNNLPKSEILPLIDEVYAKLAELQDKPGVSRTNQLPAVPIEESVTDDYIICLEDGKSFKMLKKHLMAVYGMTPEEYRAKWRLPVDYPMVAPNYAIKRQELARASGLGRKRN